MEDGGCGNAGSASLGHDVRRTHLTGVNSRLRRVYSMFVIAEPIVNDRLISWITQKSYWLVSKIGIHRETILNKRLRAISGSLVCNAKDFNFFDKQKRYAKRKNFPNTVLFVNWTRRYTNWKKIIMIYILISLSIYLIIKYHVLGRILPFNSFCLLDISQVTNHCNVMHKKETKRIKKNSCNVHCLLIIIWNRSTISINNVVGIKKLTPFTFVSHLNLKKLCAYISREVSFPPFSNFYSHLKAFYFKKVIYIYIYIYIDTQYLKHFYFIDFSLKILKCLHFSNWMPHSTLSRKLSTKLRRIHPSIVSYQIVYRIYFSLISHSIKRSFLDCTTYLTSYNTWVFQKNKRKMFMYLLNETFSFTIIIS